MDARFYLTNNLRIYDKQFALSAELLDPLPAKYPRHPIFSLFLANAAALQNNDEKAAASYRKAKAINIPDKECKTHVEDLARQGLSAAKTASASNH